MSATDVKVSSDQRQNVNRLNPTYTARVICCVLFIFLTEICLAHYVYRLISSEIRSDFVAKQDFRQLLLNELLDPSVRSELHRLLKDHDRRKRQAKNDVSYNTLEQNEEARLERNKGESWISVTSTGRIPEKALAGYCKEMHKYCPPGPQGPPGRDGLPGQVGARGDKGFPGIPGSMGARGLPGFPGEKGEQGRPGLDGRDGIPGEPGLDGIPGRNGHDGQDGLPGRDGKDGIPGRNGKDGLKGEQGPPGPIGPQGVRGIAGPRGRPGKPGNHGTPGIPGITAWKIMDKQNVSKYLIPPSIAGAQAGPMGPIVVHEKDNVRLHCSATGTPTPRITWQRVDRYPIRNGAWSDIYFPGNTLNITKVHRSHMGTYMCIADNGVPPQANQTFKLEVYFPPIIRISNQMVGVSNGSTAVLECETEAFPEPVRYWERSDGRLLENGDKYRIDNSVEKDGYRSVMQLNITRINPYDIDSYQCVSKNELQTTRGEFTLYEVSGKDPPKRMGIDRDKQRIFGVPPPDLESFEDICGPPIQCPECEAKDVGKCSPSGVSLIDLISHWEIGALNDSIKYTGLGKRVMDCVLYAVGKPVYHKFTEDSFGCWMKDASAPSEKENEKFWVTSELKPYELNEFDNKTVFRKDVFSRKYHLTNRFWGNAHVVYNGSFFYYNKDKNWVIKYHMKSEKEVKLELPVKHVNQSDMLLYNGQHNYVDFSVDDNGLWAIFALPGSNNTGVMKIDSELMTIQYAWRVGVDHKKVGEMFIVCGVLYAVDSTTERSTKIRFALDLYKESLLDVSLSFSNPFRKTTMIGYNYRNKELYSWDKGNQLTYPVRYHEIGYNYTNKDEKMDQVEAPKAQMQTGYTVY